MKPAAFAHMSLSNQSDHLWKEGELLAIRETKPFVVHLYSLHHFLVEVIFLFTTNQIEAIKIMEVCDPLSDYADMVQLPKLF